MSQFGGSRGEFPQDGSHKKVVVVVENTSNPVATKPDEAVVDTLLQYLNNTPKNLNVDEVKVIANIPGNEEHRGLAHAHCKFVASFP